MDKYMQWILCLSALLFLSACSGDKTFDDYARAGDTVAVAAGWKQNFNKDNITVTITPSSGPEIIIPSGDPAIRASINLYPDPLSSAIISRETGIDMSLFARTYAQQITANYTNNDKDWYQTTVFIDLPQTLPVGATSIKIANSEGASVSSNVEIVDGTGSPSTFTAENNLNLTPEMFGAFSRVSHNTISFSGPIIPYAIEVTLSHDPDSGAGGTGKAYAINPLGYKKNLYWNDNGTEMKAILTPATNAAFDNINDFKFYVAGNLTNLNVTSVKAYDADGNDVTNITAMSTVEH